MKRHITFHLKKILEIVSEKNNKNQKFTVEKDSKNQARQRKRLMLKKAMIL
jgi:hypothetical protein